MFYANRLVHSFTLRLISLFFLICFDVLCQSTEPLQLKPFALHIEHFCFSDLLVVVLLGQRKVSLLPHAVFVSQLPTIVFWSSLLNCFHAKSCLSFQLLFCGVCIGRCEVFGIFTKVYSLTWTFLFLWWSPASVCFYYVSTFSTWVFLELLSCLLTRSCAQFESF